MSNPEKNDLFGSKVASIFCDHIAGDLAAKTKRYLEENASLEPIQAETRRIQIFVGAEETIEVEIASFETEDENNYLYIFENPPTFPHENLRSIGLNCMGVNTFNGNISNDLRLSVEDGVLWFSYTLVGKSLCIEGRLENYQGSLEDVQNMIDSGRYRFYFLTMDTDTSLVGAVVKLERIQASKHLLSGHLNMDILDGSDDNLMNEVELVSKTFPHHQGLVAAARMYEQVKSINHRLRVSRDVFQSIKVTTPQSILMQFNLADGEVSSSCIGECLPSWCLEPKTKEEATVLLSSLAQVQVSLGDIPIAAPSNNQTLGVQILQNGRGVFMAWSGIYYLEAVFFFDESIHPYKDDEDVAQRIRFTVMPEHSNITMNGRNGPVSRIPDMTVRLLFLQLRLDRIKSHLDLLGIEVNAAEGDDEDSVAGGVDQEVEENQEENAGGHEGEGDEGAALDEQPAD